MRECIITEEMYDNLLLVNPLHCVKSVRIRSYSDPYFLAFRLNTERYEVSFRIQCKYAKIRTRMTLNTETFLAVLHSWSPNSEQAIKAILYTVNEGAVATLKIFLKGYFGTLNAAEKWFQITEKFYQ